ncbi:glutamate synthase (NADPH/NADH) small chain [Natranaerovirga hydrolytica]|uniref:Glutamate synthase (NADPH/NADH) small chain n=1 Tax=Natranaerovirga hydrolytica TaxID=680378 RepID=A0A4R1MSE4_9FIRM|nr:glutamate synthase subunit beta [Natranaerovirga hydrolytica]TCK92843.1 glutamate synthase (NADPH/NADH) small chain [Natranaerovirga hydrolytica]
MGKDTGFLEHDRKVGNYKPIDERIKNYDDIYIPLNEDEIKTQSSRCMDCGVPFCNYSCPVGNIIPDFNDLIYNNQWKKALDVLHTTNNFPEFTGKVCPAPCESGCVLGINKPPVTIKQMELAIVEKGWSEGWIKPQPPAVKTNVKIAIVGSGPSGLAAAQQLARVGHWVTVFERADEIGGLLRYGIPDFKLPKEMVENRVKQMKEEGVVFKTNANVGFNVDIQELKSSFDIILLTGGSTEPRDLSVSGRELDGIHFAMDFLPLQNKKVAGKTVDNEITAKDKNVVVIGGGDTGSDCVGTSVRQGAKNVVQLELLPMPSLERNDSCPWPTYPMILRTSTSQEEAAKVYDGDPRQYSIATKSFSGENGKVKKLHCVKLDWKKGENGRMMMEEVEGSEFTLDADLVLFAMGFLHPEHHGMLDDLGVEYDQRGNIATDETFMTSIEGIFSAGDMRRGQSLVVHAISEGRSAAKYIDEYVMGKTYLRSVL